MQIWELTSKPSGRDLWYLPVYNNFYKQKLNDQNNWRYSILKKKILRYVITDTTGVLENKVLSTLHGLDNSHVLVEQWRCPMQIFVQIRLKMEAEMET